MKIIAMKIIKFLLLVITAVFGFIFFMIFPRLFNLKEEDISIKWDQIIPTLKVIFIHLSELSYESFESFLLQGSLLEGYKYSLTIMSISTLIVISIGSIIAFAVIIMPLKLRNLAKNFLNFFEGIPDLLIIFTLQFTVIIVFKNYGIKLFQLYGFGEAQPLFFPTITTSILPSLFFAQFLINIMEEEKEKNYILLGQAKGLSKIYIYVNHLLRNIFPFIIIHFKTIFYMILSNLVLIEYMFGLGGYTHELFVALTHPRSTVLTIIYSLFLLIIPVLVLELLIGIIGKVKSKKVGVSI
ncbi:ABC transporter permease [Cytobacillus sp. FJAT-54145]|uniref:ABC transporter permease n=1 Tax=Cytobacillus spartinae TaxID=3299023 RepID=A0ABW6K870_9BACI